MDNIHKVLDEETLTVGSSVVSPLKIIPSGLEGALVGIENASVRVKFLGDPTATSGWKLEDGNTYEFDGDDIGRARFIAISGTATLQIVYYGK